MADLNQLQWQEQIANDVQAVVLDVRTEDEVNEGMIPNAMHIDIYQGQEFMDQIQKLDKTKNYYVYCRSGGRSAQACTLMNQLGFDNANNLMGGFLDWQGDVINN